MSSVGTTFWIRYPKDEPQQQILSMAVSKMPSRWDSDGLSRCEIVYLNRGRGVIHYWLPSLRTVRAILPHTALQKAGFSFKRLA